MKAIQKIILFYFSGTGNSKRVAQWFSEFAMEKGIFCQLVDIENVNSSSLEMIESDCLIGIISPIHGFNYPKITLNFIHRLPKGKNRVVLMNTRAGMKVRGKVTLGLTGVAFILSSLILKKKGYKIIGEIPFDMPSNWISIHPAIREKSAQFIFEKNYIRAKKHFEKLYSQNRNFVARKDIIQDVLISPVSFAYYAIGRFFLAKSYYVSSECTNCNLCIKQCPVKAIKKVNDRPFWTFRCESCMKCMNNCPTNAIETTHGLWIVVFYFTSVLCTYIFHNILPESIQYWAVDFLFFNVILIGLTSAFYRVQQVLLKNRFISKLISFTSLTHYKFWRRYKCN